MVIIFLGISFLVQAIFHWFGNPYFLSKKYREAVFRKEFQKGLVFPYSFLGVGWCILGLSNRTFEKQNTGSFCIWFIAIAMIPLILLVKNKERYLL